MKYLILLMLLPFASLAQDNILKGTVTHTGGNAIADATISLKHGKGKTFSNASGIFSIAFNRAHDTLVVSHVNYITVNLPIDIGMKMPLSIVMQQGQAQLEEVTVHTGFQSVARERSTGSFAKVDNPTLNLQQGSNLLDRLEGVATGVVFDRNPNRPAITVRGLSTIIGFKDPLVILDNFPYEGDINNINPNDVESITVLKDAAAASVWGTRAGNGVIVVTTKKGAYNQPLKLSFGTNMSIGQKPDLFYLPEMATTDFIDLEQFLFGKGFYSSQETSTGKPALSPVVELLIKQRNGALSAADATAQINSLRNNDVRNEYLNHFYQPATRQQYNWNIRGGNASGNYLLSFGYDRNVSNLDAASNRYTIRSANSARLTKQLTLSTNLFYARTGSGSGKPSYGSVTVLGKNVPYLRFADGQGNPLSVDRSYRSGYTDTAGAGKLLDWKYYPLEDYKHVTNDGTIQDLLADIGLNWNLGKGLSFDMKYRYENQQSVTKSISDVESYAARDMVNRYSQLNRSTGVVKYIVPLGGILRNSSAELKSWNARAQLNWNRSWQQHSIAAIAGYEVREANSTGSNYTVYGYNDELASAASTDFVNSYPNFVTGANAQIPGSPTYSDKTARYVSVYSNIAYTYLGRYTLSASGRRDASNMFGVNTNEKWNPLWSAGTGWNISKEQFYHTSWLPVLKARVTYGVSGNVDNTKSAVSTVGTYAGAAPFTNLPYGNVFQNANPELRWEKAYMWNFGLDFEAFHQRLTGSIDYYRKKGTDLFGTAPLDYTAGLMTYFLTKNVATMKGNGWDIELNIQSLQTKDWSLQHVLLSSFNTNKVTDYYLTSAQGSSYINGGTSVSPLPGQPVYSIVAYQWAGLNPTNGDPQGYVGGTVSSNYTDLTGAKTGISDMVFAGSATPTVFGSLRNTVSYRNISLSFQTSWKAGYRFRRSSISYSNLLNNYIGHSDYAARWQKPGDELLTDVPSFVYPVSSARDGFYGASEALVENASHIRLQFINFSLSVKRKQWRQMPFQSMNLFLNAANLGLLWKANSHGLDPDYPDTPPPPKTFTIGINVEL